MPVSQKEWQFGRPLFTRAGFLLTRWTFGIDGTEWALGLYAGQRQITVKMTRRIAGSLKARWGGMIVYSNGSDEWSRTTRRVI